MSSCKMVSWFGVFVLGLTFICVRTEDVLVCSPENIVPDDKAKTMPTLDKAYEAGIIISDIDNILTDSGLSQELLLGTDGIKAYAKTTIGKSETTLIGDYKRDQLISLIKIPRTSDTTICAVNSLKEAAWIFGYNKTHNPHPYDPGWVFRTSDFSEKYTGVEIVGGIPCDRWEACTEVPMRGGTKELIGLKFFWTDPTQWTPVMGIDPKTDKPYSVPVRIEMIRNVENTLKVQYQDVFRYSIPGPAEEKYQIPEGVFCANLSSDKVTVPTVPHYYSYESEIVLYEEFKSLVLYQKQYFDDELNISRVEFSPVLDDPKAPETADKPNKVGKMALVYDLNTDLSYLIDKDFGTCIVGKVQDMVDQELIEESKTHRVIRMMHPMELLKKKKDVNFTYYEEKVERGIPASVFMGRAKLKEQEIVYEFWFSAPLQEFEGENMWTTQKPIKFVVYPAIATNKKLQTIHINIYNFDVDQPDILAYDITSCTPTEGRNRLQFTLDSAYDLLPNTNVLNFKRQLLASLLTTMTIAPLRIHNLQVDSNKTSTSVSFMLLPRPKQENAIDYPDVSSEDAISQLKTKIDADNFLVGLEGPVPWTKAVKGSLRIEKLPTENKGKKENKEYKKIEYNKEYKENKKIEDKALDGYSDVARCLRVSVPRMDGSNFKFLLNNSFLLSYFWTANLTAPVRNFETYCTRELTESSSTGAFAALGVCMFLLGALIGLIIILVVLRKRIWPSSFDHAQFVNSPEAR